jgi:hypothetical protein
LEKLNLSGNKKKTEFCLLEIANKCLNLKAHDCTKIKKIISKNKEKNTL